MIHNRKPFFLIVLVCLALLCAGCSPTEVPMPEPVAEAPIVDYPYLTPEQCAEKADLVLLGSITGMTEPFTNKTDRAHPTTSEYCAWTITVSEVYSGSTDKTELTVCDHAALSECFRGEGTVVLFLNERKGGVSFNAEIDSPCYTPVGGPSGIFYREGDTLTSAWGKSYAWDEIFPLEPEAVDLALAYDGDIFGASVVGYSGEGNRAWVTCEGDYFCYAVTSVGASAFEDCATLRSVVFVENAIEEIGERAFRNCSALQKFTVPFKTETIGERAFENCTALSTLKILGCTQIGEYAFAGCTALREVIIPPDTELIRAHAFDGCTALETVTLQGDATVIEDGAFDNCPNLKVVPDR